MDYIFNREKIKDFLLGYGFSHNQLDELSDVTLWKMYLDINKKI